MMKMTVIFAAAVFTAAGGSAVAQESNPAIKDSAVAHVGHAAEGANSFTEDQARGRLTKAVYTKISDLKKDDNGRWVGVATKKGKKAHVALDYKGNVSILPATK